MIDEELDKQLSPIARANNAVSLFIDQKELHGLDRVDWKNAIIDGNWSYEVEVEKAGKIGKGSGSNISEAVKEAVAVMNGEKFEKAPEQAAVAPTKRSFWKRLFGIK